MEKLSAKKLSMEEMEQIEGGSCSNGGKTAITAIGMLSCAAAGFWPIGTLIAGPTCLGMVAGVIACN